MNEFFHDVLLSPFKICIWPLFDPMPFAFLGIDNGVKDNTIGGLEGNDSTNLVSLSSLTQASSLSPSSEVDRSEHRRRR